MKAKLLLILLMTALAVSMTQAQVMTDDLRAASEQLSHITAGKANQLNADRAQYCNAPYITYEFTDVEKVSVTITNKEAGARVYYEVYRSLSIFSEQELIDSGSFTGNQSVVDVLGGEYCYEVKAHAVKSGLTDSPENSVLFTIDEVVAPVERCIAPTVDYVVSGIEQVTINISRKEPNSRVYYEVYRDGSRIINSSFSGSSKSVLVDGGGDYEVRAYSRLSGKDDSTVAGVLFSIVEEVVAMDKCAAPTMTYELTGYDIVTVTINNNEEGATVYYEVYHDGEELIYSNSFTGSTTSFQLSCDGDMEVKAIAKQSGMEDSNWSGVYFTIDPYSSSRCETPFLSYQMTGLETATVNIQNRESGATVTYYVYKNNSYVTSGSFTGNQYNFIVEGGGDYDVYAIAKKSGKTNSFQGGVLFTIDEEVASLEPCAAPHVTSQVTDLEKVTIYMTNNESGSRVYFEIYRDGTRIYQSSFTGSSYNYIVTGEGDYVVKAYSQKSGMDQSTVSGVLFTIVEEVATVTKPLAPIVTYQTTGYETVTVTITNREPGATVQYVLVINGDVSGDAQSFTGDSYSFIIDGAGVYGILAASKKDDIQSSIAGASFTILAEEAPSALGDVNGDSDVNISDVTALIDILLSGATAPQAADCNGDSNVNISDVTTLIDYLLTGVWPSETFTVNGVSFKMITVNGGTFTMGTDESVGANGLEKPAHQVTLSTYSIGETEVTQALWVAVMGSNPSYDKDDLSQPVENVNWNDCQSFITKLNQLTGRTFRLPTEAEWEFAARGGNQSKGYLYAGSNSVNDVAWYNGNSGSTVHPVATKAPNELGLYDMSGNVYEWCQDWYGNYSSEPQINPQGPASGEYRTCRSGAYNRPAYWSLNVNRTYDSPTSRTYDTGFRIAL